MEYEKIKLPVSLGIAVSKYLMNEKGIEPKINEYGLLEFSFLPEELEMIKRIVILTVVVLSIIPILIISRYNHPSADDFGYSIKVHHAVENNASAMEILEAAFETSKEYMNTWQGLYSAAFLLALQQAAFGEKYYALTAVIMLFIVALGVFVLTHSISTNLIKSSSKSWYYIAAIIFLNSFIPNSSF